MARRPFFSGNYGSALGSYDTAARLLAGAGQAQGQMFANLGADIGGAIQKYQLNKEKRAVLTGEIEASLPQFLNDLTMTGDEDEDKKNMSRIEKFKANDMSMSDLKGFAGELARMEKQKITESALALQAAQTAAALREPRDPNAWKRWLIDQSGILGPPPGAQVNGGAQGPMGTPGVPAQPPPATTTTTVGPTPSQPGLPALSPQQMQPPLAGAYPPLPPRTGAVAQAMTPPPGARPSPRLDLRRVKPSPAQAKLVELQKEKPIFAAILESEFPMFKDLREQSGQFVPEIIGRPQNTSIEGVYAIPQRDGTVDFKNKPDAPAAPIGTTIRPKDENGKPLPYTLTNTGATTWFKNYDTDHEFDSFNDAKAEDERRGGGGKITQIEGTGKFKLDTQETPRSWNLVALEGQGKIAWYQDPKTHDLYLKNKETGKIEPVRHDPKVIIGREPPDARGRTKIRFIFDGGKIAHEALVDATGNIVSGLKELRYADLNDEQHVSALQHRIAANIATLGDYRDIRNVALYGDGRSEDGFYHYVTDVGGVETDAKRKIDEGLEKLITQIERDTNTMNAIQPRVIPRIP